MKFLIWGTGLEMEHAARLARDGHEVYYYTFWQSDFPKFKDYCIGLGIKGINKVKYFFQLVRNVDCIVMFDIGMGDLTTFLRDSGFTVYGAGLAGEMLEFSRYEFRKIQKSIGLPTQRTSKVIGVTALENHLPSALEKSGTKKVYIKLDVFRGDRDSFKVEDASKVGLIMDELRAAFGPFKEHYEFIVEDYVEAPVEVGIDGFFNGNEWIRPSLFGIEHAKSCYIGKYAYELPSVLEKTMSALTPVLQRYDYRGAISTEERIVNKDTSYLIDLSCRLPFPLSAAYTESILNFSELIYKIARREFVELQPAAKYVAVLPLETPHAENFWVDLNFPEKLRKSVKLRKAIKVDGKYVAVKGFSNVYVLVAVGNQIESLIEDLEKLADKVDADGLETDAAGGLHRVYDAIRAMQKIGIDF
jgi:hypothetical protein